MSRTIHMCPKTGNERKCNNRRSKDFAAAETTSEERVSTEKNAKPLTAGAKGHSHVGSPLKANKTSRGAGKKSISRETNVQI